MNMVLHPLQKNLPFFSSLQTGHFSIFNLVIHHIQGMHRVARMFAAPQTTKKPGEARLGDHC